MGGELAPKTKAPGPKPLKAVPPVEPARAPVTPGYAGHPGGNALDAIAKGEQAPAPAHLTNAPPREPHILHNAVRDYVRAELFEMSPLFGPKPTISSIEDAVAAATVIELKGHPLFEPNVLLERYVQGAGDAGAVLEVRYSTLCSGRIVIRWDGCAYQADARWLPIDLAELVPRDPASQLGLAVWMINGTFHGLLTTAHGANGQPNQVLDEPDGLFKAVFGRSYHGPDSLFLNSYENALAAGELRVVGAYDLHPPDGPTVTGLFSLIDEDFRFMGHGTLAVEGADVDTVNVERTPRGILSAAPNLNFAETWKSHGFEGGFKASFFDGSFEARGRVALAYPKAKPFITGDVNVFVTTPDKAWAAAKANDPSPHVTGGISRTNVTDRGLALVAWGRLDLILAPGSPKVDDKAATQPLNATAMFLIDPEGEITARGILRLPRSYELVPAYKTKPRSVFHFDKILVGGEILELLGGEVVTYGDVSVFANLGPFTLRDVIADGTYSTRSHKNDIKIAASFNASAEAHVKASAGVKVRATVGVHLPWPLPDITAGMTLFDLHLSGDASLKGYVDARPEIQRTDTGTAEEPPVYSVHGDIRVAGELLVKLGVEGTLGVPDVLQKTGSIGKTIRLASGGFSVKIDHVFGSDSMPDVTYDKVSFDAEKFVKAATDPVTKEVTDSKTHGRFHEKVQKGHPQSEDVPTTTTEPPPLSQTPDRPFEFHVPLKIHDHHHDLYLVLEPNNKSRLEMSSPTRDRVLTLIADAIEWLDTKLASLYLDVDEETLLTTQKEELEQLQLDVMELLLEANALAPELEYVHASEFPELTELAGALSEYGDRYGDDDIKGASRLLTSGHEETEVEETTPERYRFLGASRIGNTSYFEGSFDEAEGWRWGPYGTHTDAWPTGPVTRHPINKAIGLVEARDLAELKPKGLKPNSTYKTINKETEGAKAIESDVYDWRNMLNTRVAGRQKEIQQAEPDVTPKQARHRAMAEIEQSYFDLGYMDKKSQPLKFHVLTVVGETTWYCHHVQESSWEGDDEKTNLIYLVLADEHERITTWFENRRDLIEANLEIPKRRAKRKKKTP